MGWRSDISRESVRDANRHFYDRVASDYEKIDGRRSQGLVDYARARLSEARKNCGGVELLDLGSGSGFVTRSASAIFARRTAMDVSSAILAANRISFDSAVAGDIDLLPFADCRFDAVTAFSVLHHLFDFKCLISEISRVLKPGGVFYSDHDLDAAFYDRFRPLLYVYRRIYDRSSGYRSKCPEITQELYRVSEWQENGIDSEGLIEMIQGAGFEVDAYYHWYGLSSLSDRIFGSRRFSRGWAPLLSLMAKKRG